MAYSKMSYILNGNEFSLIEKSKVDGRITKRFWWKSVPKSGTNTACHFGNMLTWVDHFDIYSGRKPVGNQKIKFAETGIITVSPYYTNKFSKDPQANIYVVPMPWSDGNNPKPTIKTIDNGDNFIVECDIPLLILWSSTKGKLIVSD